MYIPFNIKTNYHLLSSLNDIDNLINKALSLNIKTLSITDDMMYSTMDFYKKCISNNIKPIIGLEIKIDDNIILLYAMNYNGYQNLTKLVYLKQEKTLTIEDLNNYKDNIICIIPFNSSCFYNDLKPIFNHLYLSYSNIYERSILKNISPKTIFINEVLYLNKEDDKLLKYLYLIRDNKKITNLNEYNLNKNYLMTIDEVLNNSDIDDLKYMEEIDKLCNIIFNNNPDLLPIYENNSINNSKVYLQSLCKLGLNKRFNNIIEDNYINRLKYELKIIDEMGFNDYFLVVYDFVKYAKTNDILVGPGRGSAAGSLVSYCLGITDVDPLKYNLLFERFLNPERKTMPDIDIDFESTRRNEVVSYVINKYGNKKALPIITFVTLGGKQAIRDVSRIFNYNSNLINNLSKAIDLNYSLKDNYKNNKKVIRILNLDDDLHKIYKIASLIEGAKRQISIHAAGIVISNYDLDSYIPLKKYEDYYLTGFSMEHLEELGLLKIDLLGLKNLTIIDNLLKDINKDNFLSFKDIPLDDKDTLDLFSNGLTEGVFQFESEGMKNFLKKLKPQSFEEITAAIALFRPGPMANIDTYIQRKNNPHLIKYLHKDLESVLKETYGIIVYQEQIMQIANIMAGYSLGEADILRRAMSKKKKEILVAEEKKFIERSVSKGYQESLAKEVYQLILKFADYGFNKSHSVAYALIGYKMAYLKTHYFKYFMSHLLTNVIGNSLKTKEYIDECIANNINVLKPEINESEYNYKVIDNGIILSLASIHNVGSIACREIIKEREKGKFIDFFDFVSRMTSKSITKKTIESLIDADCFRNFNYNHQSLLNNIDNAITYGELISNVRLLEEEKPVINVVKEMEEDLLREREFRVFGFYFNNHPTIKYKSIYNNIINVSIINQYFNKIIEVIIQVERIRVIKTKNNEDMAFINGSDESGKVDLVMFPLVYKNNSYIQRGNIIKVKGRVEKRMSSYNLSVSTIEKLL